jgi:hypothetical protein
VGRAKNAGLGTMAVNVNVKHIVGALAENENTEKLLAFLK